MAAGQAQTLAFPCGRQWRYLMLSEWGSKMHIEVIFLMTCCQIIECLNHNFTFIVWNPNKYGLQTLKIQTACFLNSTDFTLCLKSPKKFKRFFVCVISEIWTLFVRISDTLHVWKPNTPKLGFHTSRFQHQMFKLSTSLIQQLFAQK